MSFARPHSYAAAQPERIAAVASFHGGGLVTDAATSPHLVLPRVKTSLHFAHAEHDALMPAAGIQVLERALRALTEWGGAYESETYAGARHGWTGFDSPSFDDEAEKRAHAKLLGLLARRLS